MDYGKKKYDRTKEKNSHKIVFQYIVYQCVYFWRHWRNLLRERLQSMVRLVLDSLPSFTVFTDL